MEERRKLQRRHIMFYSRVFDRKTGGLLGYLGNITPGGAMVISESPLETEMVYSLSMNLPEDMYAKSALNLEAKSAWSKPDIDPNFYNTGFQFSEVTEEDVAIIKQIVGDYGFR